MGQTNKMKYVKKCFYVSFDNYDRVYEGKNKKCKKKKWFNKSDNMNVEMKIDNL